MVINVEQEVWCYQLYVLQTPKEVTTVAGNQTVHSVSSKKSFSSCESNNLNKLTKPRTAETDLRASNWHVSSKSEGLVRWYAGAFALTSLFLLKLEGLKTLGLQTLEITKIFFVQC
jgi:hypothetical protein